jgi:hypothetical protein
VARGLKKAQQPGAAEVAAPHRRFGHDLNRARLGRQVAGLVALDGRAGHADLIAQLIFDCGGGLALVGGDAVDRALEQAAEGFATIAHIALLLACSSVELSCRCFFGRPGAKITGRMVKKLAGGETII